MWVVQPRYIYGLMLILPAHSTGQAKIKFEVFGTVTSVSTSTSTAAVASDYEDLGIDDDAKA